MIMYLFQVEAHDEDTLSMLWNIGVLHSVHNLIVHHIIEVFERLLDDLEGVAVVVSFEVLDILQEHSLRSMPLDDVGYIKE